MLAFSVIALCVALTRTHPVSIEDNVIDDRQVCEKPACVDYANTILSQMDPTADPCVDFYQFACGNYNKNHPIPADATKVNSVQANVDLVCKQLKGALEEPVRDSEPDHIKKLKKVYQMCIDIDSLNSAGLKPTQDLIEKVGGWPVVTGNDPTHDWQLPFFKFLEEKHRSSSLLLLSPSTDIKNTSVRVLAVHATSHLLGHDLMLKGKDDENVRAYLEYMIDIAVLFGANNETAKEDMEKVLDFEIELVKASKTKVEALENIDDFYNMYTVKSLKEEFAGFPWDDFFRYFLPKNVVITDDRKILVVEPKFTKKVIELLKSTENRITVNYVVWRNLIDLIAHLTDEARNILEKYDSKVFGQTLRKERYKQCIDDIEDFLYASVGALYVQKYFDRTSKDVATTLVKHIREEFRETFNNANWLDEDKTHALEKIDALKEFIGYPEELLDNAKLDDMYKNFEIVDGNFIQSIVALDNFGGELMFDKLDKIKNKTDWLDYSLASTVNAYYMPSSNVISFPAAILQGAFFNAARPKYINFATIGHIIGHEMSHGFDHLGHQFDKDGNYRSWWSDTAKKDFENKTKCIVDQYDNFEIFDGTKVNGKLTAGENVGDFGGYKTAYYAYKRWLKSNEEEPGLPGLNYTNSQLFWIAGATGWCTHERPEMLKRRIILDSHAPTIHRVNGPYKNLDAFAEDYKCPKGSPMNPVHKCVPW